MLALMIWVNDKPIKGNILKLSAIVEPRKPYEEYKQGEEVKARCHGFGIVTGVIGKIADESERKRLEDILKGDEFTELVEQILTNRSTTVSSSCESHENVSANTSAPKNQAKSKNTSDSQAKQNKEKSEKRKEKKNLKRSREVLERVANELELTEFENVVQNRTQKVFTDLTGQLNAENTMSAQDSEIGQTNTSDVLGDCFDILHTHAYDSEPLQKSPMLEDAYLPKPTPVNGYVEMQLKSMQQELQSANNRISQLENNFQWLWSYVSQMQNNVRQCDVSQVNPVGQHSSTKEGIPTSSSTLVKNNVENEPLKECDEKNQAEPYACDECVGGFTMAQLESKISGVESYSKAATLLFRVLYKDEDYIGKSLTGAPSKTGERKPAVNQEGLKAIYRIIAKKFPYVTPVMVREKLRDVVKPSRANLRTPKK